MPQRSADLEQERQAFVAQLSEPKPGLQGHQEFITYWNRIDAESREVEDVGKLDEWIRFISHDRDKLHALYDRVETMRDLAMQRDMIMQILRRVLDAIHQVERRLRGRYNRRRAILLAILWRGAPGTTPKPKGLEEAKQQKDGEKREGVNPILLQPMQTQQAAAKAPTQPQQELQKRIER